MSAGLITNFFTSGFEGVRNSLLGIVIPIVLLIVLYAIRMLGAGDIKLFSALGAIFGVIYIIDIMAYSFIAGGIIAVVLIIVRKNAKERVYHLYNYLKSVFITLSFRPYTEFEDREDKGKFRFAYAVFAGTFVFIVNALSMEMLKYFQA